MISTHSNTPTKVIVGMSGGVDSSVAALLLQQQGYAVEGLFMKNWEEDDTEEFCSAAADVADAQAVCDKLNIPLHTVNFAAEYWDNVFTHFLNEYRAGRTPNPDILCNKEIKFKCFLQFAEHLGANYIATGHYARKRKLDDADKNPWALTTGVDSNKDQSYFLYTLGQTQLAKTLFPIGDHHKPQIRQLAADAGFINHAKKDSTGICFIGERKFKTFLNEYIPAQPGEMQTADGDVVGRHDGLMFYTIGQRQGLKIGGRADASENPWYVLAKDLTNNILIVGQGHDHPLLYKQTLTCQQCHWISGIAPSLPFRGQAKIRYRQPAQACELTQLDADQYQVVFSTPQRAITPGQAIVFYDDEICIGGGTIE